MSRPSNWPNATTQIFGVIGDPVAHSLSPLLHNVAYETLGLDSSYAAFRVRSGDVATAISGARALGMGGLSVTMPHKQAAARAAEQESDTVGLLHAANTILFRGGIAIAENTDGSGLIDDLLANEEFDPSGKDCAVIGAGGTGRAVVLALFRCGARSISVLNRTESRAVEATLLAPDVAKLGRPEDLGEVDLVVNTTPVAVGDAPEVPLGNRGTGSEMEGSTDVAPTAIAHFIGPGQLVVHVVYEPQESPFLVGARANGARTRNGLGMLVHQAARQVELFTDARAPIEAMWAAARAQRRSS